MLQKVKQWSEMTEREKRDELFRIKQMKQKAGQLG